MIFCPPSSSIGVYESQKVARGASGDLPSFTEHASLVSEIIKAKDDCITHRKRLNCAGAPVPTKELRLLQYTSVTR
jgi:hypothetical protein